MPEQFSGPVASDLATVVIPAPGHRLDDEKHTEMFEVVMNIVHEKAPQKLAFNLRKDDSANTAERQIADDR